MENKNRTPKSNTDKKQKMEKVITGTATVKKKSEARKFADVFIAEDARNVKSFIFLDVIVPAVKDLVVNMVQEATHRLFYGSSARTKERNGSFIADRVSYDRFSKKDDSWRRNGESRSTPSYSYDTIILSTRGDAELVLDRMCEAVKEYGMVSVADLYELVGYPDQFTDHKYGWTSMRNAGISRVRDGYRIDLPKPFPLD